MMSWRTRRKGSHRQIGLKFRERQKPPTMRDLTKLEKLTNLALKKQVQDGLAKLFDILGARGVANEIRNGRDVTGNAEYGIRHMVHDKVGPRVNVETWKFIPQTDKGRRLEEQLVEKVNLLLKEGGFPEMSPSLLSDLRKKDKEFEEKVRTRKQSG